LFYYSISREYLSLRHRIRTVMVGLCGACPPHSSAEEGSVQCACDAGYQRLCPDGWTQLDSTCVRFYHTALDWSSARQRCVDLGGDLAYTANQTQQDLFWSMAAGVRAWVGIYRSQGSWRTPGGQTISYSRWCPGHGVDLDPGSNCGLIGWESSGCWDDYVCGGSFPYLCQMDPFGPCTPCQAGTVAQTSGATCLACESGKYSAAGASMCSDCEAGKYAGATQITHSQNFLSLFPGSPPIVASPSTRYAATVGSTVRQSDTFPTYNTQGGPLGKGHVSFDRTQTQYLDGGARTFNIASNGGFTVVAVVRFRGSPGNWERVIDFGNGAADNNILLAREGTSSDLFLQFFQGGTSFNLKKSGAIVQDQWMTIVVRYRAGDRRVTLEVNGQLAGSTTADFALTDKTLSGTWVGRGHWGEDYFHGDIAGLSVIDDYSSDDKSALIVSALKDGLDFTEMQAGVGIWTGSAGCTNCTAGTYSEAASSTVCTNCIAGKYSAAAGASTCADCEAGKSSDAGSTNCT
jgi:hypothetical protein